MRHEQQLHPAEHEGRIGHRVGHPARDPGDPLPRRRQVLEPVRALDLREGERIAVHGQVDRQVDGEARHDQGERQQPPDLQPPMHPPLQVGLDGQRGDEDQAVHPRERREPAEHAGADPSVRPSEPERAERERQEEALGVADVQEVRGREDQQQERRPSTDAFAQIDRYEPVQHRPHEERRRGGDEVGRGDRGADHRVHGGDEPRVEREEDDVEIEVAGVDLPVPGWSDEVARIVGPVAEHGDVGVVRGVPRVPDLERIRERSGREHDGHDAADEERELDRQRGADELEVGAPEAQAGHGRGLYAVDRAVPRC